MATYKTLKELQEQKQTQAAAVKNQGGVQQGSVAAQSDPVSQARSLLQQQMSQRPGAFQSAYRDQLQGVADQILNQKPFSYDVNADALYQQMVDQYAQQGRLAMMDTMGHAQTMTGGYGNSYAQGAGQQAYQGYLRQANEQLPQFYAMALDRYDREQDALRQQYGMLLGQEEQDYSRYRDQLSDYYARLDRLRDQYSEERAYEYQKDRDEIADKQWQAEMDESIRQFNHIHGIGQETEGDGSSDGYGDYERWLQWLWQQENGGDGVVTPPPEYLKDPSAPKPVAFDFNPSDTAVGSAVDEEVETGFNGNTYDEATAYLRTKGLSASGLMTQSEWQRHKNNNNSADGEHEASSYQEYLSAYVYGKTK
ncbi:MAG: hypothetical protein IJA75_08755 [Oscillospiraceae bacterium]|nr:hypothetical protein [Oscillospiraceae bacterium]